MMARKNKKKIKKTTKKKIKKINRKKNKKTVRKTTKKISKKPLKKKTSKKSPKLKKALKTKTENTQGKLIGLVTHYFPHVQAAVIKLKAPLFNGETVKIKGFTTDITQIANSMQIDRVEIQNAKKGDVIGLKVNSRVRQQDKVYKI
jgi:hypothetical protein